MEKDALRLYKPCSPSLHQLDADLRVMGCMHCHLLAELPSACEAVTSREASTALEALSALVTVSVPALVIVSSTFSKPDRTEELGTIR